MAKISDLRKNYSKLQLAIENVDKNPIEQFRTWFAEALSSSNLEPNAMTLSTVNEHGRPSSRIVLLKGIEKDCFIFYSNFQSQKGKELLNNPACALNFFWPELERQVRIEGIAERVDEKTAEEYFISRPRGSQIGAWSSPQSSVIENREILDQRVLAIENRFQGVSPLPKPKQWGGYAIKPFQIEFWQGRENRLHDRLLYVNRDNEWAIYRLAP